MWPFCSHADYGSGLSSRSRRKGRCDREPSSTRRGLFKICVVAGRDEADTHRNHAWAFLSIIAHTSRSGRRLGFRWELPKLTANGDSQCRRRRALGQYGSAKGDRTSSQAPSGSRFSALFCKLELADNDDWTQIVWRRADGDRGAQRLAHGHFLVGRRPRLS